MGKGSRLEIVPEWSEVIREGVAIGAAAVLVLKTGGNKEV